MNKPINKKVLYAVFSVLFIGMIAGSGITYALTPTQTFAIYGGNYPGAPDYTVWESDGEYYAKNQLGVIVWSSTDASYILTTVLNSGASHVHVAAGTYVLTAPVQVNQSILLTGDGLQTKFNVELGIGGGFIVNKPHTVFRDFRINTVGDVLSTDESDVGITVQSSMGADPSVDGNYCDFENIQITRMGTAMVIDTVVVCTIYNPDFYNNFVGLKITGSGEYYNAQFIHILDGQIATCRDKTFWINWGKYVSFNGVYLGDHVNSSLLENFRGVYFDKCSFEAAHSIPLIVAPDGSYTRDTLSFVDSSLSIGYDIYVPENGLELWDVTGVHFDKITVANLISGSYLLSATNCSDVTMGSYIIRASTSETLISSTDSYAIDGNAPRLIKISFTVASGASNVVLDAWRGVDLGYDIQVLMLNVYLVTAPSAGKTVTVEALTSGGDTMTTTVSDTNNYGTSSSGFKYDVSTDGNFLLRYSSTAGTAASLGSITVVYYPIII